MHDVTETVVLNYGMDRACGGDSVEWMAIFLSKFDYFFLYSSFKFCMDYFGLFQIILYFYSIYFLFSVPLVLGYNPIKASKYNTSSLI